MRQRSYLKAHTTSHVHLRGTRLPCIAGATAPAAAEQQAPPPAAAAAPEEGGTKKQKKRKRKGESGAAAADDAPDGGIALFSGQAAPDAEAAAAAAGHADHADPAAKFTDSEPHVATGDPFEEANVIRKSHRIKVCTRGAAEHARLDGLASEACAGRELLWPRPLAGGGPPLLLALLRPTPTKLCRYRELRRRRRCAALPSWRASRGAASGCWGARGRWALARAELPAGCMA